MEQSTVTVSRLWTDLNFLVGKYRVVADSYMLLYWALERYHVDRPLRLCRTQEFSATSTSLSNLLNKPVRLGYMASDSSTFAFR